MATHKRRRKYPKNEREWETNVWRGWWDGKTMLEVPHTWLGRGVWRETLAGEDVSGGGASDQVSRSEVVVWGFRTGVALCIVLSLSVSVSLSLSLSLVLLSSYNFLFFFFWWTCNLQVLSGFILRLEFGFYRRRKCFTVLPSKFWYQIIVPKSILKFDRNYQRKLK